MQSKKRARRCQSPEDDAPRSPASIDHDSADEQSNFGDYLRKITQAKQDADDKQRADEEQAERVILEQVQQTCNKMLDEDNVREFIKENMVHTAEMKGDHVHLFSIFACKYHTSMTWSLNGRDPRSKPLQDEMDKLFKIACKHDKMCLLEKYIIDGLSARFTGVTFTMDECNIMEYRFFAQW